MNILMKVTLHDLLFLTFFRFSQRICYWNYTTFGHTFQKRIVLNTTLVLMITLTTNYFTLRLQNFKVVLVPVIANRCGGAVI